MKQPSTCDCNSELDSLREKTAQIGTFGCSESRSLLQVELGLTCVLSDPGPTSPTSESTASHFAWVVLEDEAFQAKMVAARIKRKGGDQTVNVQSVLQVSTFIETLVQSVLYNIARPVTAAKGAIDKTRKNRHDPCLFNRIPQHLCPCLCGHQRCGTQAAVDL